MLAESSWVTFRSVIATVGAGNFAPLGIPKMLEFLQWVTTNVIATHLKSSSSSCSGSCPFYDMGISQKSLHAVLIKSPQSGSSSPTYAGGPY